MIFEAKNTAITDSIRYARLIQEAILLPSDNLSNIFSDYFLLFLPKDIVSGDFYWAGEIDGNKIIAVADCTGHGVPGAFMSLLGLSFFNNKLKTVEEISSGIILQELRKYVINSLHQSKTNVTNKDGMDISISLIKPDVKTLQFSGANNPLIRICGNELIIHNSP